MEIDPATLHSARAVPASPMSAWHDATRLAEAVEHIAGRFPRGAGALLATRMRQAATSVLEELGGPPGEMAPPSLHDRLSRAEAHLADLASHASIAVDLGYCGTGEGLAVRDQARHLARRAYLLRTGQ